MAWITLTLKSLFLGARVQRVRPEEFSKAVRLGEKAYMT